METIKIGKTVVCYNPNELTAGQARRQFQLAQADAEKHGGRYTEKYYAVSMSAGETWKERLKIFKREMGGGKHE